MRFNRIGGTLVSGGVVTLALGYALEIGSVAGGGIVVGVATVAIGGGAAVLCIWGPAPLAGRAVRSGLGLLAAGAAGLVGATVVGSTLTYDPLESWPFVVLGVAGLGLVALGLLVTSLALFRAPGRSRAVGALLLAGPVLFALAGLLGPGATEPPLRFIVGAVAVLSALGFFLGGIGLGLIAIGGAPAPAD